MASLSPARADPRAAFKDREAFYSAAGGQATRSSQLERSTSWGLAVRVSASAPLRIASTNLGGDTGDVERPSTVMEFASYRHADGRHRLPEAPSAGPRSPKHYGRWPVVSRRERSALGVSGVVLALLMALTGCGLSGSQRQDAIDSFGVPNGWVELTSPIMSGEFREGMCIGPIDCRVSLVVQWRVPDQPSAVFLQTAAQAAGWKQIEFVRPCDDESRRCQLRAKHDRVDLSLSYRPPQPDGIASWVVRLAAE